MAVSPDENFEASREAEGWRTLRWAEDAAMAREREAAAEAARVAAAAHSVAPKNAASRGWTIDARINRPENGEVGERRGARRTDSVGFDGSVRARVRSRGGCVPERGVFSPSVSCA